MIEGQFIVVEGLDGAGKSTACKMIAATLQSNTNREVVSVREPAGTILGEQLGKLTEQPTPAEPIYDEVELLLTYAARAQLMQQVIKPALARGAWVIADRHDLSTQAYESGGRNVSQLLLEQMHKHFLANFKPNITFYLDVEPDVAKMRILNRGALDRYERAVFLSFAKIRERYLALAAEDATIITIDAAKPVEEVHAQITPKLASLL